MTYQFAVSPDVHARDLSNWFILNTWLQRITSESFHATLYGDFQELHQAIATNSIDLIYANAADTAVLVRDKGFTPIVRAKGVADEATVVAAADSPIHSLDDMSTALTVAATDAPDVERICRILLEPADLDWGAIQLVRKSNYVLVAKSLISKESEAGFFLKAAFDELSDITKKMLRPVISSKIYVVGHSLLGSPAIAHLRGSILTGLLRMSDLELAAGLGAPNGWESMSIDDADFLIDLMDTLAS